MSRLSDEDRLAEVAKLVRCGVGTLQSADRTADAARRRAVAAWMLRTQRGWTLARIAAALHRSERQVARMLVGQASRPGR